MLFMVSISPRRFAKALTIVVLCLTLASIAGQFSKYVLGYGGLFGFVRLFHTDSEGNIPAFYSSSTLLLCSILLATIASAKKRGGDRYALHWRALAIIFLFLSLDEAASIHESGTERLRSALDAGGLLYFTWVIPGAAFVLLFVAAYLGFLADLPAKTRRGFLVAGTTFVGGALGMEMVGGRFAESYGVQNMRYQMIATVEELLEMLGIVVFIYALMSYMDTHVGEVQVHIGEEKPGS
jgi:hypothetical protein